MSVQLPTAYQQRYGTRKIPLPVTNLDLMEDNSIRGVYIASPVSEPFEFLLIYSELSLSEAQEFETAYTDSVSGDPDIIDVDFNYDPESSSHNGYFLERPELLNIPGNKWEVSCRLWGK